MLPARKPKPSSGILRRPSRVFRRHEAFVRSHLCCIGDKHLCTGPIVLAHVRTGTDGGTGEKPSSWWTISLCNGAHLRQHAIGEPAFEREFGIDMKKLASEFAARSPDQKMKAAMKEMGL